MACFARRPSDLAAVLRWVLAAIVVVAVGGARHPAPPRRLRGGSRARAGAARASADLLERPQRAVRARLRARHPRRVRGARAGGRARDGDGGDPDPRRRGLLPPVPRRHRDRGRRAAPLRLAGAAAAAADRAARGGSGRSRWRSCTRTAPRRWPRRPTSSRRGRTRAGRCSPSSPPPSAARRCCGCSPCRWSGASTRFRRPGRRVRVAAALASAALAVAALGAAWVAFDGGDRVRDQYRRVRARQHRRSRDGHAPAALRGRQQRPPRRLARRARHVHAPSRCTAPERARSSSPGSASGP